MGRLFIILGSFNMFMSVALGAFGAHMLRGLVTAERLAVYNTGVHYHMVHALGLIAVGIFIGQIGMSKTLTWAGWLLQFGIICFSFSLYFLVMLNAGWLGAITPVGGVAFLIGWILLAVSAARTIKR